MSRDEFVELKKHLSHDRSCFYVLLLGAALFFISGTVSTIQHRGIPIESFGADNGLTEDEFRSKHGRPDSIQKFGHKTIWSYGLGPWGISRGDGVVFSKDHRAEFFSSIERSEARGV